MALTEVFSTSVVRREPEPATRLMRADAVIAELHRCAAACRDYVESGPDGLDPERRRSAVALAASSAEICGLTASLLPRGDRSVRGLSKRALELCLDACARCARECDRQPGDAARSCAEGCRRVVRSAGGIAPEPHRPDPSGCGPHWSVDPVDRTVDVRG